MLNFWLVASVCDCLKVSFSFFFSICYFLRVYKDFGFQKSYSMLGILMHETVGSS